MVALSVVVPVMNEAENVAPLAREIVAATKGEEAEIIFIDDGSTDGTADALKALKREIPQLRVMQHERNSGQSRGVRTGVLAARGEIIVTLDGDGQNDPADISKLLTVLRGAPPDERVGMVTGVRAQRNDVANRRFASSFANGFRRRMLNDQATDSGSGIKAFRREMFLMLPYFDHMHRFMTALVLREGYDVRFVEVNHRPRTAGKSKYTNLHRALVGIIDVFGVRWLQRRSGGWVESREI
jgi:glycosyltransferase involved in cell wall biosynthesis